MSYFLYVGYNHYYFSLSLFFIYNDIDTKKCKQLMSKLESWGSHV